MHPVGNAIEAFTMRMHKSVAIFEDVYRCWMYKWRNVLFGPVEDQEFSR